MEQNLNTDDIGPLKVPAAEEVQQIMDDVQEIVQQELEATSLNFNKCVLCQQWRKGRLVKYPAPGSHEKLMANLKLKAFYGQEFCKAVWDQFEYYSITADVLKEKGAKWHPDCLSYIISKGSLASLRKRYLKNTPKVDINTCIMVKNYY